MIRKLSHKSLDEEDLNFIHYYQLLEGRKDVFMKEAKRDQAVQTAVQMKKDGMSTISIAKYTGLSIIEIEVL